MATTFETRKSSGVAQRKGWVAAITGSCDQFGIKREFVAPGTEYISGSRKKMQQIWSDLEDGTYEVRDITSHENGFYLVDGGVVTACARPEFGHMTA